MVIGGFESGKGRPTVTVYNHLDVVPASKETEPWKTEPLAIDTQKCRGILGGSRDPPAP